MKTLLLSAILVIKASFIIGQWPSDPMINLDIATLPGEEAIPKVASTPNGNTYIAWFSNENGNYNVRLQKLDMFGNKLWDNEGLLVSDHLSMTWLTDWDMTTDMDEGTVLVLQDIRTGNNDAFAYRISSEGEFTWGEDGIPLSSGSAFDAAPKVVVTEMNNTVVAWQADEVVILQKISPEGDKLWGEDGIVLSSSNTFSWPQLMAVNDDDIILKYFEDSGPVWAPVRHVYAMRYDSEGNTVWDNPAIISNAGGISAWTQIFSIISDGNDGFYISWHDDRDNNMLSSAFIQHINQDGQPVFPSNGAEASLQAGRNNFYPYLALPDNSEEVYLFWNEMDGDQNNRGIYVQKFSAAGDRLWSDNGKTIIEISPTHVYPFSAGSNGEHMIVFFEKTLGGINAGVNSMMIDKEGEFAWTQEIVELCSVASEKVHSTTGHFNNGQWVLAWEDNRNGGKDIFGQNIKDDGSLGHVIPVTWLDISPDTLYFDYSQPYPPLPVWIFNNSPQNIEIEYVTELGVLPWMQISYLPVPYLLPAGDSVELLIDIIWSDLETNSAYNYDTLNINTADSNYTVTIAILEGYVNTPDHDIDDAISVYPIPAKSSLTFDLDNTNKKIDRLLISDSFGTVVKTFSNPGKSICRWNLLNDCEAKVPPGIYFYQISFDGQVKSGKVIVH